MMTPHKIKLKAPILRTHRKYALIIYSFFINNYKLKTMGNTILIKLSNNTCELYSQAPVSSISIPYLYCLEDYGEIYSFDIRTLQMLCKCDNIRNPYTGNILNEAVCIDISKKISFLEKLGFPINYNMTAAPISINDIIHKLHMLDFDIKKQWIHDISLTNIRKICLECYSRYLNASSSVKYNINTKQVLFSEFPTKKLLREYLAKINDHNEAINFLFLLLDKFISYGKNREYKKIGAMYFLQAIIKHGRSEPIKNAFFYLH